MIRVQGRHEAYEFEGVQLGHGTSYIPGASRWSETTIWQTSSGRYVIQKKGCSNVVHAVDGICFSRGSRVTITDPANIVPCSTCAAPSTAGAEVIREIDLCNVRTTNSPDGVVQILTNVNADGVHYMNNVSAAALRAAASNDQQISNAMRVRKL